MMCIMQTLRVVLFESRGMLAHLPLILDTDRVQPDCGTGFGRLEVGGAALGPLCPGAAGGLACALSSSMTSLGTILS